MTQPLRPAVFLDRDGTLITDCHYLKNPEHIDILPGVIDGLRALQEAGFLLIIVSNQSGIGRGLLTARDFFDCQTRLLTLLGDDISIPGHYFCPHHPHEAFPPYLRECNCRKPQPQMLFQARDHHHIDLSRSFMVGDKVSDVEAGIAAGCRSIHLSSSCNACDAIAHADCFSDAVDCILNATV